MISTLELGFFSLDVYLRGREGRASAPGEGELLQANSGTPVGGGYIVTNSDDAIGSSTSGFYACAYKVGNEVIISYRGANQLPPQSLTHENWWVNLDGDDVANINSGYVGMSEQVQLGFDFYNLVAALPEAQGCEIVLTGHSLGGGIAGIVAGLKNVRAEVFNNIGFERDHLVFPSAAHRVFDKAVANPESRIGQAVFGGADPWAIDLSKISSTVLLNDIAEFTRMGITIEQTVLDANVRRQIIWRSLGLGLAEYRPRLWVDVMRRACGAASADAGWFVV